MPNNLVDEIMGNYYTAIYQDELYVLSCSEERDCGCTIRKLNDKKQWQTLESDINIRDVHIRSFFISPSGLAFILFGEIEKEENVHFIFKDINSRYSPWSYESFYNMGEDIADYRLMSQKQLLYSQVICGMIHQQKQVQENIKGFFSSKREEPKEEKWEELKIGASGHHEEALYKLRIELEQTIESKNSRIENLLNIIKEKERIIDRLYNLLKLTR